MILLESQPLTFRTAFETASDCNRINNKTYCAMYNQEDTLYMQWQTAPCGDNIACNYPFTGNLINNPTFIGNADGWTLNSPWAWTSGHIHATANDSFNPAIYPVVIEEGHCYLIQYTISQYASGSITPYVGGVAGVTRTANGSHREIITAGTDQEIKFVIVANTALSVDDVYLYDLDCLCADNANIDVESGDLCHLPGSQTIISGLADTVPGKYYKAAITVENWTQGELTINLGEFGHSFFGNGTFTAYDIAQGTDFTYTMDSDFDGCITEVTLYEMNAVEDWEVGLFDLDGNWIAPINTFGGDNTTIFLDDDFVTLKWLISNGDAHGNAIAEGCYKICVVDPCLETGYTPLFDGSKLFEDSFDSDEDWTLDAHLEITGGNLVFTSTNAEYTATASYPFDVCFPACEYNVRVGFSAIDDEYLGETIEFVIEAVSYELEITQDIIDNLQAEFTITISNCFTNGLDINFTSLATAPDKIIALSEIIITVPQECLFEHFDPSYCSNCISIKEDHDCTVLMTAYCNESSLGFNFDTFQLRSRLRALFINPISKNRNENYKFSNGTYFKNFAERDKVFDVLFDYVDEVAHDAINTSLICDVLKFQSTGIPNNDEYVWKDEDYKPEWDREGRQNIAQARIQLQKKSGALTNSNCS